MKVSKLVNVSLCSLLVWALFVGISTTAIAESKAPFGLKWGLTIAETKKIGLVGKIVRINKNFVIFRIKQFPIHPSDTDKGAAIFDKNFGLQKIVWYSKYITGDAYGQEGKRKFSELKKIIIENYNQVKRTRENQAMHLTLYKEVDEFYQCLAYDGCGYWSILWNISGEQVIYLQIKSSGRRGRGWIQIAYEGPNFGKAANANKKREIERKRKAF